MRHRPRTRRVQPGASPGSIIAPEGSPPPQMYYMAYGPDGTEEGPIRDVAEIAELRKRHGRIWVNVDGLGDAAVLESLGDEFRLHRLALEDVVHLPQRPKAESYEDHLFLVVRIPVSPEGIDTEQVSLFLGTDYVLTFQERPGDCFDPVRRRIRGGRPRLKDGGPDSLAYALLDLVVDSFFPVLEKRQEKMERLEDAIIREPSDRHAALIHELRHELSMLRHDVWPLRELHSVLLTSEDPLISDSTQIYLRDSQDHVNHLLDLLESYRDTATAMMDLHLSLMSQRMNEVMKVLTIIATIFIPLSFIAGLYGMNFDPDVSRWNMPELRWAWGYPAALGLMATVAGGMLLFFRRRGWFR